MAEMHVMRICMVSGETKHKPKPKDGVQLALRVNTALAIAIGVEVERRQADHSGGSVPRSEVVRDTLMKVLLPQPRAGVQKALPRATNFTEGRKSR